MSRFHFPGHTLTGGQLLDAVERAAAGLGLEPTRGFRRGGMPWGLIRALAWAVPMWHELVKMSYLWRVPHALDGAALTRALGALPSTRIDQTLRESLLALGFGSAGPTAQTSPAR